MNIDVMYSKKSDDWKTPTAIYQAFKNKGFIDCFKYQSTYDETHNYYFGKKLFINPPFSKMNKITKWILDQVSNENIVALLIPARTDTKYFHELMEYQPQVIFIKGRLHYNDSLSAPFPTILLIYDKEGRNTYKYKSQEELLKYIDKYL